MNNYKSVDSWIKKQKSKLVFSVKKKNLINLNKWIITKKTISHESKKFFNVVGVRVKTNFHKNSIIHGNLKETFSSGSAKTADAIAKKIVDASVNRKREVIQSWKTFFGIHVNYWFPKILDKYLIKKQDGK